MADEGLEPSYEVVGCREVGEMGVQLCVALVVKALDRNVLNRAVHLLHLAIGLRVVWLGQPVR